MILIAGDSLTAGMAGIAYRNYLNMSEKVSPGVRKSDESLQKTVPSQNTQQSSRQDFLIRGVDGDTMSGITSRVLMYLRGRKSRTISGIIIEAGHNDLLIPHMASISESWKSAMAYMKTDGKHPIPDVNEFIETYRRVLTEIIKKAEMKGISRSRIAVTDLMPLGEDLSSPLNRKRTLLGRKIHELTDELEIQSISLAEPAERVLHNRQDQKSRDRQQDEKPALERSEDTFYLIPDPQSITDDARFIHSSNGTGINSEKDSLSGEKLAEQERRAAILSSRRGLLLTVDGVHPNAAGARLIAEAVMKTVSGFADAASAR